MSKIVLTSVVVVILSAAFYTSAMRAADTEKVALRITGGDETDARDRGRPVALVAGALRVSPEVFRDAFSQVKPAPAGTEPDPAQVRRNKEALLAALGRYGVTNDELDRVSNQYRYVPGGRRKWPMKSAAGYAVIENGSVTSLVLTDPGYGYNSLPQVTVPGHSGLALDVQLVFDSDLKKNGSLSIKATDPAANDQPPSLARVLPPGAVTKLHLTVAQQREIAALEKEVGARLAKILTVEQQQQLQGWRNEK
jgi:hypothetical protein